MKSLFYAVFILLITIQSGMADDRDAAKKLLENKIDEAIAVLSKKDLDRQAKDKRVLEIVTPMFDFRLMAKLSLGRKYWPNLAEEKKDEFTDLFVKRLKANYIGRLSLYEDQSVIYKKPVQTRKKVKIPTEVVSKDNKISMLYKMYKTKNTWKIYDIEIDGVSIISTYRSQFDQVLRESTIDDLLLKLEKPENK